MNSSFLENIATQLVARHANDLSNAMAIVPSQRAGNALKKEIARLTGTAWAPATLTFPQWVETITGKSIANTYELTLGLFTGHAKSTPGTSTDITEFLEWSGIVLSDFNDIDQYLLQASQVFRNLESYSEIEHWSFAMEPLSKQQLQFSSFWKQTGRLYAWFSEWQKEMGKFSYGALLRYANENITAVNSTMLGKTLYFVGVHALNTGEERLVRQMESALGATVFVDGDELYIRDIQDHEAGTFLRGLLKENATLQWIGDHFRTSKKEIRISEATTGIGQVFAAVKYWQDAPPGESKVVVLNDEQLVTPLRKAFADEGLHVSFKGTSALQSLAYRWMHNWLELQVRMEEQGERSALPARELVRFFSSAMVTMSEPQLGGNFREWVIRNNKVFVGRNDLEKFSPKSEWVKQVLLGWNRTPAEWLKAAEAFLQRHGEEEGADYGMVEEYRSAKMWLSQLELSLEIQGIRYESLLHLLKLLVSQHRLREEVGEGEKVQVMGLLETRSLDFDHVIMLSADEKNLPKSSSYNSFIPHDIRALFHLPVRHDREALFAYNFYRLLQRASKIDILYSMASDDFNRTEPSRYITQIRNEFPSYNPNIVLTEVKVKIPGARAGSEKIVATNDFIRNKLDELFASGISPSALNTYNRCSLDFYYKYLVGLNEAEEAEENIDRAVFGQVVHKTLENFYGNFVDSFPGVKDLTDFAENARKFVEECLTDAEFSKYDWTGENALALEIAVAMVSKFAVTDLEEGMEEEVTRIIKGIEVPLEWNIRSEDSGWHTDVILRGKADRIEQFGSLVRILDYKTGQVNNTDALIPKKLEEMFGPNAKPKLLQLLIYQYVHCRMHGLPPGNVIPGLYSMKNHTQGTVWLHADSKMGELPGLDTIEKGILSMVKRIYETEMFTHNPKSDFCSYCES